MNDRALIGFGMAGAVIAAVCSAAQLLVVGLPLAGVGAWPPGADLVMLPLILAALGLVAWGIHRRRARVACSSTKIQNESAKP